MIPFFDLFRRRNPILISVCIVTIPEREFMLEALLDKIVSQSIDLYFKRIGVDVEVLVTECTEFNLTIGAKRNALLDRAKGDYVCFIDDDDDISGDYMLKLAEGVKNNPDCCSLTGEFTTDGKNPLPFIHSIQYSAYSTQGGVYFRPPNHLNCIRSSIAKQFRFPEKNWAEDTEWALAIAASGLLKKESLIPGTIYYYKYISNKPKPKHA